MFVLISAAAGFALIALGFWARRKGLQSDTWPSTGGVITESRVDDFDTDNIQPRIAYRYTVAQREFHGSRIAYSGYGANRAAMAALVARYPVNGMCRFTSILSHRKYRSWRIGLQRTGCYGLAAG
jgi:hypothetical protein